MPLLLPASHQRCLYFCQEPHTEVNPNILRQFSALLHASSLAEFKTHVVFSASFGRFPDKEGMTWWITVLSLLAPRDMQKICPFVHVDTCMCVHRHLVYPKAQKLVHSAGKKTGLFFWGLNPVRTHILPCKHICVAAKVMLWLLTFLYTWMQTSVNPGGHFSNQNPYKSLMLLRQASLTRLQTPVMGSLIYEVGRFYKKAQFCFCRTQGCVLSDHLHLFLFIYLYINACTHQIHSIHTFSSVHTLCIFNLFIHTQKDTHTYIW